MRVLAFRALRSDNFFPAGGIRGSLIGFDAWRGRLDSGLVKEYYAI
jgi:hypothetical protein